MLLFLYNFCQGQNTKVKKEVKNIIKSNDLVVFKDGKFTKGKCTLHGDDRVNSVELNLYVQAIPSQESCQAFLICDHEVTVQEYVEFLLDVTKVDNFGEVSINETYTFDLKGEKVSISLLPNISHMEGIGKGYLTDEKYLEYPIIGINWLQANAYIFWLNSKLEPKLKKRGISTTSNKFILPSDLQWEYAASIYRDDRIHKKERIRNMKYYPLKDGEMVMNDGQFYANFGTIKNEAGVISKSPQDDGFKYTAPVKSFPADNDLYDLAGNVSEWTASKVEVDQKQNVIIKGGSFMSEPIFMQVGVYQLQTETFQSNAIGFRIAMELENNLILFLE